METPAFIRRLVLGRDDNGYVTNEIPWGSLEQGQKVSLHAGVEETLTVPSWAFRIKYTIAPGGVVWCGHGSTALVVATDTFSNELSELNPIIRPVFDSAANRISTLRFLSENDTWAHVIFYDRNYSDLTK